MRRVRMIVCALAAILAAAAGPVRAETVVRWATPEPPLTWDPHGSVWAYSLMGQIQVYETLTRITPDFHLEPALATSWKLVDPRTWRFELRRDVRFHDGTPLTAADVAFSLERAMGEGSGIKHWAGSLERAAAVGPSTVEVRTKSPDLLLPMRLRTLPVMSRAWLEAHGVAAATAQGKDQGTYARDHAMGTGPFRLVEHVPGGRTVLERNPDWWDTGQHPHEVDRIVWTPINDDGERVAALLRGEVDFIQAVPGGAIPEIRATPGLKVAETPSLRVFFLSFNQGLDELPGSDVKGRNPFRDRRVREAVYRAIDVGGLIRDALGGAAEPAGMIVAPGVNGWLDELDRRLPHDPVGARRLLAEAGYPDGFAVPLLCQPSREPLCRNIAGQLSRVGLTVITDIRPDDVYEALIDSDAAEFHLEDYQGVTYDSAEYLRIYFHTGGWLSRGYANPELDARIEVIEAELSSPIRDALIEQVWRQLFADVVVVPLYRPTYAWGMRDWLALPTSRRNVPTFSDARLTSPR